MTRVVVMAGGRGTRLSPLTLTRPKPMCPVLDKPILEHNIEKLKKQGFEDFVFTVGYMSDVIREHFGDGSDLGVSISYSEEKVPMGTAGGVRKALGEVDETFVIVSGDLFMDWDVDRQLDFHLKNEAEVTIGLSKVENPSQFGIVETDSGGRVRRFLEKPKSLGEVFSDTINAGVYVLEPSVLEMIPREKKYDFSKNLFPRMLGEDARLFGFEGGRFWIDIGFPGNYLKALEFAILREKLGEENVEVEGRVWVGKNVSIGKDVVLKGPTMIGSNSKIGDSSEIKSSIVYPGSEVGEGVVADETILGRGVEVGEESTLGKKSVLGDYCVVGRRVFVGEGVKIWPNKSIKHSRRVTRDVVS